MDGDGSKFRLPDAHGSLPAIQGLDRCRGHPSLAVKELDNLAYSNAKHVDKIMCLFAVQNDYTLGPLVWRKETAHRCRRV